MTPKEGKQVIADLVFNTGHEIFNGHFPGNPVVPGACLIQIIQEVLNSHKPKKKFELSEAKTIKFLSPLSPEDNQNIKLELTLKNSDQDNRLNAAGRIFNKEKIFMKFSVKYATAEK